MNRLDPEILDFYDSEVVKMIVAKYGYGERDALSKFLESQTYSMLANPDMEMCEFGPVGIFNIWECEKNSGSPLTSDYLRMS